MFRRVIIAVSSLVARGHAGVRSTTAKRRSRRLRPGAVAAADRTDSRRAAAAQLVRVLPRADGLLSVDDLATPQQGRAGHARTRTATRDREAMTAGHFIFIPSVLLVGVVVGWVLGSRAARDAFAVELKRREERAARKSGMRNWVIGNRVLIAESMTWRPQSSNPYPSNYPIIQLPDSRIRYRPSARRRASGSGSPTFSIFSCVISSGYARRIKSSCFASVS